MSRLMERLQEDHQHLAKLLDLLERLLDQFHEGTEPDYEILAELLEYMDLYADQVHHPTEDLIFDRMRGLSEAPASVLDVLSNQHEALREIAKQFRASVEGIVNGEVMRRDLVEAHGRDLVNTLRTHLNLEEAEAFPLALELLSEEDWKALYKEASKITDPVFGDRDSQRFQALYEQLLAESEA